MAEIYPELTSVYQECVFPVIMMADEGDKLEKKYCSTIVVTYFIKLFIRLKNK